VLEARQDGLRLVALTQRRERTDETPMSAEISGRSTLTAT
jgi:hypothetical protein